MSKLLNGQADDRKIISLKTITSDQINGSSNQSNVEEEFVSLQMKVENVKQELVSLEQQKEKRIQELQKTIDEKKQAWEKQKEVEKQAAQEEGYRTGFEQGKEEAKAKYKERIDQVNELVQLATNDYYQTVKKHENTIIKLAILTAEKIINQQIAADPSNFLSIITKAIEELKDHSHVTIYVHPNEYSFVVKQKEELEQLVEEGEMISIYIDQQLNPGDCVIKHPFGQLNVGIDSQLQQIKNALVENIMENP